MEDVEAGGEMGNCEACAIVYHPALHVMDGDGCSGVKTVDGQNAAFHRKLYL